MINEKKKKILLNIMFILLYSFCASIITNSNFLCLILANTFFIIVFNSNFDLFKEKKEKIIYIIINIVMLILLVYNAKYKNLPFTNVDWTSFDLFAKTTLSNSNNVIDILLKSIDAFTAFVTCIYHFFGQNINQVYFFILPCAGVLFRYVYKIMYEITDNYKKSVIIAYLSLLWPVNFIFSLSLLREVPIEMFICISIFHFIKYLKTNSMKQFIISLCLLFVPILMHSGLICLLLVYLYVFLQNKLKKQVNYIDWKILFFSFALVLLLALTPIWDFVSRRFYGINSIEDILFILKWHNDTLVANTAYVKWLPTTRTGLILHIPYRMILFVFTPFLWQTYDFGTFLAFLFDGVWRIFIMYFVIKIFVETKKYKPFDQKIIKMFAMLLVGFYLIFGMGTNNYGTSMRHRMKLFPLELILIGSYSNVFDNKKVKIVLDKCFSTEIQ